MPIIQYATIFNWITGKTDPSLNSAVCPEYQRQPNFDTESYMGTWYEIKKSITNEFEQKTSCTTQYWTLEDDGSTRTTNRSRGPTGSYGGGTLTGVESKVDGPGSFVQVVFGEPDPNSKGSYNVVETDYEAYAIFYDCDEESGSKKESFGILSRTPSMSEDLTDQLEARMKALVPSFDYDSNVIDVVQDDDCVYETYPEDN